MIDTDTFLTILYVTADDYCQPGIFSGFSFAPASAEDQDVRPLRRIGGSNAWYFSNWLWQFGSFLDLLLREWGPSRAPRPRINAPGRYRRLVERSSR